MSQRSSRVRWLLVAWLFVLSAVAFLDRVNLNVAATHLAADFRLSDVQLGALFSFFLLGYALFQTPAGWLADRWGPRRVLAGGVIWWGVFTALTASVPAAARNPVFLLVLARFLLGAGEAVTYPSSNQFIARWIPTQERGMANGVIFAGVGVGSALAPPLVTYVILHYGWRFSFWICACIGFVVGLVWFLAARDGPQRHALVSPAELEIIRSGLTLDSTPSANRAAVPWHAILANRSVLFLTISYFSYGYVAWIFF